MTRLITIPKIMDVSIIIVNYHTAQLVIDCLKSVYEKTDGITFEIIIVDNASGDNYDKIIAEEFPDKNIKFITLPENIGFGRANNAGFEIANGRNILCLNPDTILINNAIKILSDYLDANPDVGACGGNLYDEQMNPTLSFRRMLPGIRWELSELCHLIPEKILYGGNSHFNFSDEVITVGYITGADLMIPQKILNSVNGFSEKFFMYYEETDLCKRIAKLGYRVKNIPFAKIQHLEGRSFSSGDTFNPLKIERSEYGRYIYYHRNLSMFHRLAANFIYLTFLSTRRLFSFSDIKRKVYAKRLSVFKF